MAASLKLSENLESGQAPHHEAARRGVDEHLAGGTASFVVSIESSNLAEHAQGPLHHPTPRPATRLGKVWALAAIVLYPARIDGNEGFQRGRRIGIHEDTE